jgi:ribosomal protein S18 acetylase RimI-like enzyme
MAEQLLLRQATSADLPALVGLDEAIFGWYGAQESAEIIGARLVVFPAGCIVLAETDGAGNSAIVGYLTTEKWLDLREPALDEDPNLTHQEAGTVLNITTLAVAPGQQRRGLGAQLLDQAKRIAISQGCRDIVLETAHAEHFYQQHGFIKRGERTERGIALTIMHYRFDQPVT